MATLQILSSRKHCIAHNHLSDLNLLNRLYRVCGSAIERKHYAGVIGLFKPV